MVCLEVLKGKVGKPPHRYANENNRDPGEWIVKVGAIQREVKPNSVPIGTVGSIVEFHKDVGETKPAQGVWRNNKPILLHFDVKAIDDTKKGFEEFSVVLVEVINVTVPPGYGAASHTFWRLIEFFPEQIFVFVCEFVFDEVHGFALKEIIEPNRKCDEPAPEQTEWKEEDAEDDAWPSKLLRKFCVCH